MDNKVTIDIEAILKLEDNSITDSETIRQIGLATTQWGLLTRDKSFALSRKIKKEFTFAALYPHVMKPFDITPEQKAELEQIEKITRMATDLLAERIKNKK